jgi:hypothetical protein
MSGVVVVLGGLTGLHAATWGAFKDTPFEGFRRRSFLRSVVLGLLAGSVVALGSATLPLLLVVGVLYAAERLATEWWKAFLRDDDQAAYTIPMRLAVGGRPVDARLPRYATGVAVAVALALLVVLVPRVAPHDPPTGLTVLVGGLGGWLTAVGGAWKDAPVEGFSGWKFLRSPAVATTWAVLLLPLTRDWLLLAVAAGGLSVLVIETYKTFLTGGRPPGKFAGRPVRFVGRPVRDRCRVLHCLVHGLLAAVALGTPALVVPVCGGVAVAMLVTGQRAVVRVGTAAREPDVDAKLRRETA